MRTYKNVLRHELIGLPCSVTMPSAQREIRGTIIDETMNMIQLQTANGRKSVPKHLTVFRVIVGNTTVEIDGDVLVCRPEDRIKKKFKKW